jgi:hypothetical protein
MNAWAEGVCSGVHAAGSRDVVYVPDNPLSHVLRPASSCGMPSSAPADKSGCGLTLV